MALQREHAAARKLQRERAQADAHATGHRLAPFTGIPRRSGVLKAATCFGDGCRLTMVINYRTHTNGWCERPPLGEQAIITGVGVPPPCPLEATR